MPGNAIARAFPGASVEITDFNSAIVDNLKTVVSNQGLPNVHVSTLDWNVGLDPACALALPTSPPPDVIVAAGACFLYVHCNLGVCACNIRYVVLASARLRKYSLECTKIFTCMCAYAR